VRIDLFFAAAREPFRRGSAKPRRLTRCKVVTTSLLQSRGVLAQYPAR
jgi:hypothetical protein